MQMNYVDVKRGACNIVDHFVVGNFKVLKREEQESTNWQTPKISFAGLTPPKLILFRCR